MASSELVRLVFHREDKWAEIRFCRPEKRNAFSLGMWRDLEAAVEKAGEDPDVRVLLLRGEGGQAFSAGADIGEFHLTRDTDEHARMYRDTINYALEAIQMIECPVIAVVEGFAFGGGCELAMAADLRIARENARFSIGAARLGTVVSYANVRHLVGEIGGAAARELLVFGRIFDAREALERGLVSHVVSGSDLEEFIQGVIRETVCLSRFSVGAFKAMIRAAVHGTDVETGESEFDPKTVGYIYTPHFRDRSRAFSRKPDR